MKAIDIVVNPYTPQEVEQGQTGIDEVFQDQIRMPAEMRGGVTVDDYVEKMNRADIELSLMIAVRAGDMRLAGSFEISYERVHEICQSHPTRFAGLAGVDPYRGMQGLRDLESGVRDYGFVGAHLYPHWFELAPDDAKYYPYYAKCCELDVPIMMQVGHSLVYQRERRMRSVGRPICLDQVACDFPELKLLGIHIGIPWTDEMISMAWEARARLHRRRCLCAALLAAAARSLSEHLRPPQGAVRHRLAGNRPGACRGRDRRTRPAPGGVQGTDAGERTPRLQVAAGGGRRRLRPHHG